MIEAGVYKARGVDCAMGWAGTGTEQIAVLLEITEGPHKGQTITWYGFFTEKTTDRTLEALEALGWPGDNILTITDCIGQNEVEIQVENEEYTTKSGEIRTTARVQWINSPRGTGRIALHEQMNPTELASFAQNLQGTLLARKQRRGGKPSPAPSNGNKQPAQPVQPKPHAQRAPARPARAVPPPPTPDDDDIPF